MATTTPANNPSANQPRTTDGKYSTFARPKGSGLGLDAASVLGFGEDLGAGAAPHCTLCRTDIDSGDICADCNAELQAERAATIAVHQANEARLDAALAEDESPADRAAAASYREYLADRDEMSDEPAVDDHVETALHHADVAAEQQAIAELRARLDEQPFETTFEQILAAGPDRLAIAAEKHGISVDEMHAEAYQAITHADGTTSSTAEAYLMSLGDERLAALADDAKQARRDHAALAARGIARCPDCGQFIDPTAHACPRPWGKVEVKEGARTPWGQADYVKQIAPGIVTVSTPGHGGVKVSPERNALIPPALRNRSGWYEEDCEAAIVGMYFPEMAEMSGYYAPADQQRWANDRRQTVKDWFPDQYMAATGETLRPDQSYTLLDREKITNKEAFRAEHAEEFVTLGNGDTHAKWIPKGYAVTKARIDATGETRDFLMPYDEVIKNGMWGTHAIVDPNRHLDVTEVLNARPAMASPYSHDQARPKISGPSIGVDYGSLTPAQARRAQAELDKRWRFRDDDGTETIETLGEHFAHVGLTGKHVSASGTRDTVTYTVEYGDSRVHEISKAAFDALTGVPDTTDALGQARVVEKRAEERLNRAAREKWNSPRDLSEGIAKENKAKAEYAAARAETQRLRDEADAASRVYQEALAASKAAAFEALLAERGMSTADFAD